MGNRLHLRLEKRTNNIWAIVVTETNVVLASRRWGHTYQAVRWCRAVMSSFRENYTLEISDG
jgi:hypothetical protein